MKKEDYSYFIYILEYRVLGKKGEGTFSEVLKCQNVRDGTFWAAKKMKQLYKRSVNLKEKAIKVLKSY